MIPIPEPLSAEAATRGVLRKKVFLEIWQNLQENTCARVSFLIKLRNFIKKEALVQVFSYEFCQISENTIFSEHLWTTASISDWFNAKLKTTH